MANEQIWADGTEIILETAAGSAAISDTDYYECTDDNLQPADIGGYLLGVFEFDTAAAGFTADLTAGAALEVIEQRINSDSADEPDVSANYPGHLLWTFTFQTGTSSDVQQKLVSDPVRINKTGAKFWLHWNDGGSGTAGIALGWELRVVPRTLGT